MPAKITPRPVTSAERREAAGIRIAGCEAPAALGGAAVESLLPIYADAEGGA